METDGVTRRADRVAVALICVAAAVGGACSATHPTGYRVPDLLYPALLAVVFTLLASVTSRGALLTVTAVGVAMSRGWLWLPASVALVAAFVAVLPNRRNAILGAAIGALEIQVILRWPPLWFHGSTALLAGLATLTCAAFAWRTVRSRTRRFILLGATAAIAGAVVLSAPTLLAALTAKGSADRGAAAARSALDDVDRGDPPDAVADLQRASLYFHLAYGRSSAWWTMGGELVPIVAQQHHAVVTLSHAGGSLATDAAGEAGAIDFHQLTTHGGHVDLAAVDGLMKPLSALDTQLASAKKVASASGSQWLVPPIAAPLSRLTGALARAKSSADLATDAVQQVPGILGVDGVRHYLVVFMTPAETRGLDGFLGAYAELTVQNGKLSVSRTGLPKELTAPGGGPYLSGPADYVARYGAFDPQDHLEDVSYSPDFPTVANVLADLYPQVGGDHIDGVLAIDPYTLAALLQFTGPISIPGIPEPLDSANAASILLRQQYIDIPANSAQAQRHDVLQQALAIGFQRLISGSLPAPKALGAALGPEVREGRLLFWTTTPSAHPLLHQLGLDGAFPPTRSGDLLGVTIADAGNDKIDAYLYEKISDHVVYNPATGRVDCQVTVTLDNTASTNLPDYVIGSFAGSGLPLGTNFMWLSLYTPFVWSNAELDHKPFKFEPGVAELGVNAYSGFIRIPVASTATLTVSLHGYLHVKPSFSTTLRIQPLASPTSVAVSVEPASGWQLDPPDTGAWRAGTDEVQSHMWKFRK